MPESILGGEKASLKTRLIGSSQISIKASVFNGRLENLLAIVKNVFFFQQVTEDWDE